MACEIIDRIARVAPIKEVRARNARPRETKPEELAFATPLFECWRSITGTRPGKNLTRKKNPSLVYVATAWKDVFGQDENRDDDPQFIGALRSLSDEG